MPSDGLNERANNLTQMRWGAGTTALTGVARWQMAASPRLT
jgi:hypothetical protein